MRAERVAKMRGDILRERDAIAALRAEWTTLENPARIQGLARRHLRLRPAEATHIDCARPAAGAARRSSCSAPLADAIADTIEDLNPVTGSVPRADGATTDSDRGSKRSAGP